MNRIATSGKSNAGREAERLLGEMIASYNGTSPIAPNRNSFNTAIKAYANAGGRNATQNAKRILAMMENPASIGLQDISKQIMPDKISYTSILMTWGNDISGRSRGEECNIDDQGEDAEGMLHRMIEMYESGRNRSVRPDTVSVFLSMTRTFR
jgi:hypothetical protein